MSTKERRQREFDAREQLFLDRTRELIQSEGLLSLQMAKLAHECDYATGTLYQHFASKEDLLLALATRDIARREDYFERIAAWSRPSRECMTALVIADSQFLKAHADIYRLGQFVTTEVVWERASADRRQAYIAACDPLSQAVNHIVANAITAGDLHDRYSSIESASFGCWSLSVGAHALMHTRGMLEHYEIHAPYVLMAQHLQSLLNGMQWQSIAEPAQQQIPFLETLCEKIRQEVFDDALPQ